MAVPWVSTIWILSWWKNSLYRARYQGDSLPADPECQLLMPTGKKNKTTSHVDIQQEHIFLCQDINVTTPITANVQSSSIQSSCKGNPKPYICLINMVNGCLYFLPYLFFLFLMKHQSSICSLAMQVRNLIGQKVCTVRTHKGKERRVVDDLLFHNWYFLGMVGCCRS